MGSLFFCLVGTFAAVGNAAVTDLTCEYLVEPLGIDATAPRLGWHLNSERRGEMQSAYQVLVASSIENLDADNGDLWNSGRVGSDQSIQVPYAGTPLQSHMKCYWKVRVWDKDGGESQWSEPSFWTMGVLQPGDWQGKWIGDGKQPLRALEMPNFSKSGARWIWHGPPGEKSKPGGRAFFRRHFGIGRDCPITAARLILSADDRCTVYFNGKEVGKTDDWHYASEWEIDPLVVAGDNVIAVSAANDTEGPAGVIARVEVVFAMGDPLVFVSDGQWRVSDQEVAGWNEQTFDDSSWPLASDVAGADEAPWATIYNIKGVTQPDPSPLFRKTFDARKPVKSATVTVCGLGYYELHINGERVGDHVLDPLFTRYDRTALYVTHDVTDKIRDGRNAIGVMLGNGWFNMHARCVWNFDIAPWRKNPRLLLNLRVEYEDGSVECVATDKSWKTAPGPVVHDSVRTGEFYDARLELPGWDEPDFDDAGWVRAAIVDSRTTLRAQQANPNRITETITPVTITEPSPGIYVVDMGRNISGWTQISAEGPAGTTITMRHDERLTPDGLVDQQQNASLTYSGEFQTDKYTLKGVGTETWEPRFTYHGFQYVQVEGYPGKLTADKIRGRVVHTAFPSNGKFECANDILNKTQRNTLWAYVGNFVGIPTDCPHREKNGWTGDAQLAAEQALFNFNSVTNYEKWMDDFRDEQRDSGELPGIVPTSGWGYGIGPAWDSAYVLIPWYVYVYCGNTRVLEENFDNMVRFVESMRARAKDNILDYGLGDWVPPKDSKETPVAVTSTGYYFVDVSLLSEMARILGRREEQDEYAALAEEIRKSFNAKFYDAAGGMYAGDTQAAYACALYQGLASPEATPKAVANLLRELARHDGHLACGILGAKYVMNALADNGHVDEAYAAATKTTFPGWGYWIEQGATTLWEQWDGENSQNHVMFGDISAWCYKYLAGISPDPEAPGFKRVIIRPRPPRGLEWARGEHRSPYGLIAGSWRKDSGRFFLDVVIPPNTTASVFVPAVKLEDVTESEKPASGAAGVAYMGMDGAAAVFEVGSGKYHFESTLPE